MSTSEAIVITGVGLTSPLGDSLADLRAGLLAGRPRVETYTPRYMPECPAGRVHFPVQKWQSRKDARRGTRAGAITIFCGREALADAGLSPESIDRARAGVFVGLTEHGNAEFEAEWVNLAAFDHDVKYWSHHHNPRTVLNSPAGELCLNAGITGPHCSVGAACAAGNYGVIYAAQQLLLGEVDLALAGGVSEAMHFGIFASFKAQNALAPRPPDGDVGRASRPFDRGRNGIVIAEGGCLFALERKSDAQKRGARVYGELAGWAVNTDATDFVLPNAQRQAECMALALRRAGLAPEELDLLNAHATATPEGDVKEVEAIRTVFGAGGPAHVNATKGYWGHAMGAAGALGLAGNLGSFADGQVHPTVNLDDPDPACALDRLVANRAIPARRPIRHFMVNAFGMLGTNASVIVRKP